MKRISLALIALFAILVLMMVENTKAACPTGYNVRTVQLTINGCDYLVDICSICHTVGIGDPPFTSIRIMGYKAVNPNCQQTWDLERILQEIEAQILNFDFIFNVICNPIPAPPCPNESENWEYISYYCYKFNPGDQWCRPCDYDNYCRATMYFCYKDGVYQRHVKTSIPNGTQYCTKEAGQALPGECFKHHSPCLP